MKILIASTPATGHLNPLLAMARILIADGHEVAILSGSVLRDRIVGIGAKFHAFPPGADFDLRDFASVAPELKSMPPGLDWLRGARVRRFHSCSAQGLAAGHTRLHGSTCSEFIYSRRLDHAARLLHRRALLGTGQPLSEVAYACGFRDYAHFARKFRHRFGYPPGAHQTWSKRQ